MSRIKIKTVVSEYDRNSITIERLKELSKEFYLRYNQFTKIDKLLKCSCRKCNMPIDIDYKTRFQLAVGENLHFLNSQVRLKKLLNYFNLKNELVLVAVIGVPGGGTIDEINGIRYFWHPKETNHTPHVHAKYSGEEMSISLLTGDTRGDFKNKKKSKEAKQYVKEHQVELTEKYNLYTNGINVLI